MNEFTATYTPEDNKLRLYATQRLDAETYEKIKRLGFKWAPKQELFVKPRWTPEAEDYLLTLCGEIEDEDKTPEDRAADRAERFEGYRDKREAEAHEHADTYDAGPAVHGFQSAARAERAARRHDRERTRAVTQWDKAEYWQRRTQGVISHALYKSSPDVRRGRILKLEKEIRELERSIKESAEYLKTWCKIRETKDPKEQTEKALFISNYRTYGGWNIKHPRKDKKGSLYSLLTDKEDPITGAEAAALALNGHTSDDPEDMKSVKRCRRWIRQLENRITYEKEMLKAHHGTADEVEMVPGGFIKDQQIIRVNKSPVTKKPTSVVILAPQRFYRGDGPAPIVETTVNIQRAGADAYRAPTDEELSEFKRSEAHRKAAQKAAKPKQPKLLNLSPEDAQKLQDLWNARAVKKYSNKYNNDDDFKSTITEIEQKRFSQYSKGSYSKYETVNIDKNGFEIMPNYRYSREDVLKMTHFKIRLAPRNGESVYSPQSIVSLTDKSFHSLPELEPVKEEVNA
jgi:hypothetical protein